MTQKERILGALIQVSSGLTLVELRDRTGFPDASLRTNIWVMRKDGWIEIVGGVRGRYRYGITRQGRRQAPAQTIDVIAERFRQAFGFVLPGSVIPEAELLPPAQNRRRLLDFVHWLAKERGSLLATDDRDIVLKLEEAAADFFHLSGQEDPLRLGIGHRVLSERNDDP